MLWYAPGTLVPPTIAKVGEVAAVEITCLVAPEAYEASILKSSPAPVGMFLICNAPITAKPTLLSGWPEISDRAVGAAPARPVAPAGTATVFRMLYEAVTSCTKPEIWNRPQA